MASFVLGTDADQSVLGGAQFNTVAFEMDGEFREIQFQFTQSGLDEDAEIHWMEFFYKLAGSSHEAL